MRVFHALNLMNELTKSANDVMRRLAAELGIVVENRSTREVWAEINAAEIKAAAEYKLPPGHTTVIFGRLGGRMAEIMKERGVPSRLCKSFTGGYDDYDGTMYWAEVPGYVEGPVSRFSPNPGRWMHGVRV